MAVRWPIKSASMRRPRAGKAEIHEAERTLTRFRLERLTFAFVLAAGENVISQHRTSMSWPRGRAGIT